MERHQLDMPESNLSTQMGGVRQHHFLSGDYLVHRGNISWIRHYCCYHTFSHSTRDPEMLITKISLLMLLFIFGTTFHIMGSP
ncbi:hypothetical protein AMECASPLE_014809 [Ameca splendens]|uniref:Uncharacterized protein n=1 Tax=Ameca splendens TaxID=208324 RepID=A0ABV0Z0L1_9TELE